MRNFHWFHTGVIQVIKNSQDIVYKRFFAVIHQNMDVYHYYYFHVNLS